MGFFMFLPIVAAIMGLIIALLSFMGICLILIGITGIIMNKLYMKQTKTDSKVAKSLGNTASIVLGVAFILFPLGCVLYGIVAALV